MQAYREKEETRTYPSRFSDVTGSVFLQPVAAPLILGLLSFAAATLMIGAHFAGWYGSSSTPLLLSPFIGFLGITQIIAAIWSFRARDGLATAFLGGWGAFWLGYASLQLLSARGVLPIPSGTFTELGFWYIALAAITFSTAWAAFARNTALAITLLAATASAVLLAISNMGSFGTLTTIAGYVLLASAAAAWYTASAYLLGEVSGRRVMPIGRTMREEDLARVERYETEPGVIREI